MQPTSSHIPAAGAGIAGSPKAVLVLALLLLAVFALGVVFDPIPLEDAASLVSKVAALVAILAVLALGVGVLIRLKRSGDLPGDGPAPAGRSSPGSGPPDAGPRLARGAALRHPSRVTHAQSGDARRAHACSARPRHLIP